MQHIVRNCLSGLITLAVAAVLVLIYITKRAKADSVGFMLSSLLNPTLLCIAFLLFSAGFLASWLLGRR